MLLRRPVATGGDDVRSMAEDAAMEQRRGAKRWPEILFGVYLLLQAATLLYSLYEFFAGMPAARPNDSGGAVVTVRVMPARVLLMLLVVAVTAALVWAGVLALRGRRLALLLAVPLQALQCVYVVIPGGAAFLFRAGVHFGIRWASQSGIALELGLGGDANLHFAGTPSDGNGTTVGVNLLALILLAWVIERVRRRPGHSV